MQKFQCSFTGKLYEVKRQYPLFKQLERGMNDVKKELNRSDKKQKCNKC